jgi:hypothetical protein
MLVDEKKERRNHTDNYTKEKRSEIEHIEYTETYK